MFIQVGKYYHRRDGIGCKVVNQIAPNYYSVEMTASPINYMKGVQVVDSDGRFGITKNHRDLVELITDPILIEQIEKHLSESYEWEY